MLHVVTGAPASGKTTFVHKHAKPNDLVIDLDAIANTIALTDTWEHSPHVLQVAKAARHAAIRTALKHVHTHDVWIIQTFLSNARRQQYAQYNAKIHVINPGKSVVLKRIKNERPLSAQAVALQWFETQTTKVLRDAPIRRGQKYGQAHKKQRNSLLLHLRDGEQCGWCGRLMTRDMILHADHTIEGQHATRLLHAACNEQRGDGLEDYRAPIHGNLDSYPALPIRYKKGHTPQKTHKTIWD